MYEQRLTERLRSQEEEPMRRGKQSRKRCIDSVVAHLQCILNGLLLKPEIQQLVQLLLASRVS